ncbi:hypothetical protein K503DRAFT_834450 [Rhizopogon vinicolor AM-OR11-026]|uniref:JAB1/MPN/MOV34 metalloenzyme domain-containing protein n=1 Tax=Rhizopogon vinicolor AM-OR11-026 TaxID=1314800 RepID=A0A1B7MNW7_9AGAM|nr:hypothetical protein K503DRAFT_834450 [Rhizopogon vinicolor AM-OR11-026]
MLNKQMGIHPSIITLAGTTVVLPVIHPLVLLSITDHQPHAISRNSLKHVVGVLLGQDNGKTINVANSFGILFEEDERDSKTVFLDHNYIEGMYEMFRKVNEYSHQLFDIPLLHILPEQEIAPGYMPPSAL